MKVCFIGLLSHIKDAATHDEVVLSGECVITHNEGTLQKVSTNHDQKRHKK